MPSVNVLLQSPALAGLERLGDSGGDRTVRAVAFVEHLSDLELAEAENLVLVSRTGSAEAVDYRLDVAVRWAAIRQAAGILIAAQRHWRPSLTAREIARRESIALIRVPEDKDLGLLIRVLSNEIHGDTSRALERADAALSAVAVGEAEGSAPDQLAWLAGQALGVEIAYWPALLPDAQPAPELCVPVTVSGNARGWLAVSGAAGALAIATRLVLQAVAAASARQLESAARSTEMPIRSRSELLSALLMSDSIHREDLVSAARSAGMLIDGWHLAVHLELNWNGEAGIIDELASFERVESAARVAFQRVASSGGSWTFTRFARTILLVNMTSSDPGPLAGGLTAGVASLAADAIEAQFPAVRVRAGVGSAHEGVLGLRASVTEARAIVASARTVGRTPRVMTFDGAGIHRMLLEWYATDSAREAVRVQLLPLEQLGGSKAESAIRTLKTYLDHQGSVVHTAKALHLHRNAVTYRLRRLTQLLGMDLDDPDQRLALQLACRARLIE